MTINNQLTATALGPIPSKILYDNSGIPQGFMVGETSFAFVRNLQGDVIAMVDCEGDIVVEYSYDPWGNIEYHLAEGVTEDEAIIFTALCPLTYRGYNYDFTTGLYYLQSRYYNPEWGRFLNCDDTNVLLATQGETHNANLFAYCNNNSVNRVDYRGLNSEEAVTNAISSLLITATFSSILKTKDDIKKYFYTHTHPDYKTISVTIYINKSNFYKIIWEATKIDKDLTYLFLACMVDDLVKENEKRELLFSIQCIAYEIQWHVDAFLYSLGLEEQLSQSSNYDQYGVYIGLGFEFFVQSYFYEHCKDVNIAEEDVYTSKQAKTFKYNKGIRSCYKYTNADPYMKTSGKRSNAKVAVANRNNWRKAIGKYAKG